jgi:hypothetical protein
MAGSNRAIFCDVCFDMVVDRCLPESLVGGEAFSVDASLIAAESTSNAPSLGIRRRLRAAAKPFCQGETDAVGLSRTLG